MSVLRTMFYFALAALTAAVVNFVSGAAAEAPVKIIGIGDSYIAAGYGKFPTTLQEALKSRGHLVEVIDTGYKVTSASGLEWLLEPAGQKLLAAPAGHAVILELGSNDCTRFDLDRTRSNLDQILSQLMEKHIPVLLVGTQPYAHCAGIRGAGYPIAYRQIFPDLAKQYGVILYPNFKDGVSGHPELLLSDNDHPNAAGEAIIVNRMLPSVEALIAQATQK